MYRSIYAPEVKAVNHPLTLIEEANDGLETRQKYQAGSF